MARIWIWMQAIAWCIKGLSAIYFAQERPVYCLPSNSRAGTLVGRLFAYQNSRDNCTSEILRYDVIDDKPRFAVNASGWLSLHAPLPDNSAGFVEFNVSASCTTSNGVDVVSVTPVTVDIHAPDVGGPAANIGDSEVKRLCFEGFPDSVLVEENIKDISLGKINNCANKDGYSRKYTIFKPKNRFTIDPDTSELLVTKEFDREGLGTNTSKGEMNITGIQPLRVRCELTRGARLFPPQTRRLTVHVLDVDDNPPILRQRNNSQEIHFDKELADGKEQFKINEIVFDKDQWQYRNTTYRVDVITDPLHVCKLDIGFYPTHGQTVGWFTVVPQNLHAITDTLYRCQVALVDTEFEPTTDTTYTNKVMITVDLHQPPKDKVPTAQSFKAARRVNFYRNTTWLARLLQITEDPAKAPSNSLATTYSLTNPIFKVTPLTGIVYVADLDALAGADDSVSLTIARSNGADTNVIINMFGTPREDKYCDDLCASHDSKAACESSCGFGLVTGSCTMRGSETDRGISKNYGTCTYDKDLCPNGVCDELEDLYPMLCPQDCTVDKVVGMGFLNQSLTPPRGIVEAKSPCYCDNTLVCTCMPWNPKLKLEPPPNPDAGEKSMTTSTTTTTTPSPTLTSTTTSGDKRAALAKTLTQIEDVAVTTLYNITDQSQMVALATEETTPTCGKACGTAIGLGLGAVIAISFSLFMLWFTKRRNDRRKNNLKHVGSVVSMSAVPSDYVEDRERQLSYSSPSWSPKGPIITSHIQSLHYEHSKWEVPRENLTLEKTLGEGEFGLVMKAHATSIGGDNRPRDVAVKMLKHCSTQLEEQDLWSEFTLLTDVSHPNVIRLLGACTGDGPFYIIVEYCEHGCLLKYLRRSRLVENGYINTRMRYKSPSASEQTDPDLEGDLLDLRDLLSFAWQIAKGMSYLSEIKLVHRDLAARNVLVAAGKMIKISDFGLTRDVYEADTYLKKSRGRIPVKWLAPESLYAQIYTTRSDVWSYGIVLWEIVTLGAPPYPGIPPERLYNLLMGGYRMDRPENCTDEMYAVMQKCWKIDAADRPSFACLANIFDRILQEKTGYLDLSQGISHVQDLYNKCFESSGGGRVSVNNAGDASTSLSTNVDVHRPSADDAIDNINLTTVNNELYNQDTYLTPTSPVSSEPDNKTVPLLGQQNSSPRKEQTDSPSIDKKDTKNENDTPLFIKKLLENKSPINSKGNSCKNKNVIYPCEKLSLLMGNGSARFSTSITELSEDPDETLRIEID